MSVIRVRSCGFKEVEQQQHLSRHRLHRELSRDMDVGQTLYVRLKYYVIYRSAAENLPLGIIQAQHQKLNMVFNGLNPTGLAQIPSTGRYAFANVIGNPKIVFLPSNAIDLQEQHLIRLSYSGAPFPGLDKTEAYVTSQGFPPVDGVLNVYLAPMDQILGESDVGGNRSSVEVLSVGGDYNRGALPDYDLGMTVCHEIGHAMSLTHTWDSTEQVQIMPDIPIQKNPNYVFEFLPGGNARNCNRMKDCARFANYPGYTGPEDDGAAASWLCTGPPCAACNDTSILFEMGCCVMDYATDANMAMFSAAQSSAMRNCLLSGSNHVGLTVSDGGQVTIASPNDTFASEKPSAAQNKPDVTDLWNRYKTYFIVGIVLGAAVLLTILGILLGILIKHKKRKTKN